MRPEAPPAFWAGSRRRPARGYPADSRRSFRRVGFSLYFNGRIFPTVPFCSVRSVFLLRHFDLFGPYDPSVLDFETETRPYCPIPRSPPQAGRVKVSLYFPAIFGRFLFRFFPKFLCIDVLVASSY